MSGPQAPGQKQKLARRVVQHLLGGSELRPMITVVAVLVGVGWFADSLYGWLEDIGNALEGHPVADWLPLHRVIAVTAFVSGFLYLYQLARAARTRYRPSIESTTEHPKVRGLILYLSNLSAKDEQGLRAKMTGLVDMQGFCALPERLNWRMPLEAIDYHLPRLSDVILICSAGDGGSARQATLFKELVARLFPQATVRLAELGELEPKYLNGISFDDVDRVADATDDAYAYLTDKGLTDGEILIDITGGYKTNAIAGMAVALAEGRRIQYVSTETYGVCVYDVTYENDEVSG
jgi:hypothetical protein